MFRQTVLFVCILFVSINMITSKMPDYLKKCNRNSDLTNCLKENWQAASKYLMEHGGDELMKIEHFSNLSIPLIDLAVSPQLHIIVRNAIYTGLTRFQMHEISLTNGVLQIKGNFDEMDLVGAYALRGRILLLPIEGEGEAHFNVKNLELVYSSKLQKEERNGKTYFYVDNRSENTQMKFTALGGWSMYFSNLFGGDPQLGREMNALLNENWREVFQETRPGLENFEALYVFNPLINSYLRSIPIDELFE